MRILLALSSLLLLASAGCRTPDPRPAPVRPPNLVIVYPDQWRGSALGFLDEEPVQTPNLDRFARESVVLTQAAANYPVCSPSRAMMMTGQYPPSNGVLTNANSNSAPFGYELSTSARTWSDVLSDQGYSLGYIGKWHLESPHPPYVESYNNRGDLKWNEWTPPERRHGFDFWYSYGTYDQHLRPMYWATRTPRDSAFIVDQWGPEHEADVAIDYIRNEGGRYREEDRPFALVVSMNPPHTPYDQVPQPYLDRYAGMTDEELIVLGSVDPTGDTEGARLARQSTRNYFALMTGVDEQFGRILDALEAQGLSENTIVLFTSDHGNCLGAHEQVSKNVAYECSMRVPFLLRYPAALEPRRDDLLLSTPDIYPTLLDMMGFRKAIPAAVEGRSLASILRTGEGERPTSQPYFYVPYGRPADGRRGVRTQRYTFVAEETGGGSLLYRLYDRSSDPWELQNVAEERPEVVNRLREELRRWLEAVDDPWVAHL